MLLRARKETEGYFWKGEEGPALVSLLPSCLQDHGFLPSSTDCWLGGQRWAEKGGEGGGGRPMPSDGGPCGLWRGSRKKKVK